LSVVVGGFNVLVLNVILV